ncbi:unnamed protein product [Protopolystoma xenopodis]|uniref:Uncharacterized protein n=1 Tax=Protopolystoma xenopodis TaxID=117903 RepID=A0A3S5AX66_9PLAT|nr:unnamed protein product [Protopolystoma xenopodis]
MVIRMTRFTDDADYDAGEKSVYVTRPRLYSGNDGAYNGFRTRSFAPTSRLASFALFLFAGPTPHHCPIRGPSGPGDACNVCLSARRPLSVYMLIGLPFCQSVHPNDRLA